MAGLKQIMEIFMTINQPLSSEQRVRWYIQRGPQKFGGQIVIIYSSFYVKFIYSSALFEASVSTCSTSVRG